MTKRNLNIKYEEVEKGDLTGALVRRCLIGKVLRTLLEFKERVRR
jgi:hypothetical protein